MSTRGHKSRQIRPSFLRGRHNASSLAMKRYVPTPGRVLVRVASRIFRRLRRAAGLPGNQWSMLPMKRSLHRFSPCLSGHTLRASSDARRHCAALLSGLLSQSEFGPLLQNARLGAWESGHSHPNAQRPRAGAPVSVVEDVLSSPDPHPGHPGLRWRSGSQHPASGRITGALPAGGGSSRSSSRLELARGPGPRQQSAAAPLTHTTRPLPPGLTARTPAAENRPAT
jgi:hypothetical protein